MKATVFQRYGSCFVALAVAASFAVFPSPYCFDCEPMYNWGLSDATASRNAHIAIACLIGTPLIAVILGLGRTWFIPIVIAAADIATQHLAGVPWWDIRNNEGPVIGLVDLAVGFASLALGLFIRFAIHWLLHRKFSPSTANGESINKPVDLRNAVINDAAERYHTHAD